MIRSFPFRKIPIMIKYIYRRTLFNLIEAGVRIALSLLFRLGSKRSSQIRARSIVISLEGGHGAGKTTQTKLLQNALSKKDLSVYLLSLPAYESTYTSKVLHLLYNRYANVFYSVQQVIPLFNVWIILLDFWEARQRLIHTIHKEKRTGQLIVLSARGLLSTYAYNLPFLEDFFQSRRNGFVLLEKYTSLLWQPDIIYYLEVRPDKLLSRLQKQGGSRTLEELNKTQTYYTVSMEHLSSKSEFEFSFVDGDRMPDVICNEVAADILRLYSISSNTHS